VVDTPSCNYQRFALAIVEPVYRSFDEKVTEKRLMEVAVVRDVDAKVGRKLIEDSSLLPKWIR
jgi:hypothetical protein